MFEHSSRHYDAIYSFKDYAAEAARVRDLIGTFSRSSGHALLDVACGTGKHLEHLQAWFAVQGLDLDAGLLAVARERLPDVSLYHGDMRDFSLPDRFDAVTCLFSAIGYLAGTAELNRTAANMARHLKPGGVLLVEGWLQPEQVRDNYLTAVFVDEDDLKLARISVTRLVGRQTVFDFHYLVGTPAGVEHFVENHRLTVFTHEEYMQALQAAGLEAHFEPEGLTGRGLYIGIAAGD